MREEISPLRRGAVVIKVKGGKGGIKDRRTDEK